jgi:ABC-2 type transport system permease protein
MTATANLATMEWRLLRREPIVLFFGLVFPLAMLVVMGIASDGADRDLGGLSLIQAYVPILIAFVVGMFATSSLPTALAVYRERGVLRRLATTPVAPSRVLVAQVAVNGAIAVAALVVVLAVAHVAFDVALPQAPLGFVLAFLLTAAAMYGIGVVIGSVAPTARTAGAIGTLIWFPLMFFAGLWVPREAMGDTLRAVSDLTPLGAGVGAIQDAMGGSFPDAGHLAVLAAYAVVAAVLATRLFRWE